MKLLEFWTNFNKTAKLLLIVLAGFLAFSLYHSFTSESKLDKWRSDFEEFRKEAAATVALSERLQQLADSAVAVADSATEKADSLTIEVQEQGERIEELEEQTEVVVAANDSTFEELTEGKTEREVVAENPPVVEPWIRLAFSQRQEVSLLSQRIGLFETQIVDFEQRDVARLTTITSLRAGLLAQMARADSLQQIVINIPEGPPTEKLLGIIPLPSRKTSFFVGAIVGVVTIVTVENALSTGK